MGVFLRGLLIALCIVGLTLTPRAAHGQENGDQPEPNPADLARFQYGSFAFTPAFVFSTGHDSNVIRDPVGFPGYETYVVPQVEAFVTLGRARFQGTGAAEFVHLNDHPEEGGSNRAFGASFKLADSPFRPYANYTDRHTNARPTGFEIGERSLRVERQFNAGAFLRATDRTSFRLGASWNRINYDAADIYLGSSLQEKLNRDTDSYLGSVGFDLTPLTTLSLNVDTIRDRFKFSPERDGDSIRVMPGLEFASPAVITGAAYVGYRHFTSKASGAADFSGLVANGYLTYGRPQGDVLAVRFGRDLQFSYDPSLAYYILTGVDSSYTRRVWDRFEVLGFGGLYALDYRPAGTPASIGVVDHYYELGGGVAYRVGDWSRVGVSVESYEKTGSQPYEGVRAILFITYGSGRFLRLDRPVPFEQQF